MLYLWLLYDPAIAVGPPAGGCCLADCPPAVGAWLLRGEFMPYACPGYGVLFGNEP